jgi:hypothetical protein
VIWENGVPVDLNSRIANKDLTLTYANDIDDEGHIVGGASNAVTGQQPGFVAIPVFELED